MSFPGRIIGQTWHLIDAKNQTVGRLAAAITPLLKGTYKPTYRVNGE
jgi:ribosomal protein L13